MINFNSAISAIRDNNGFRPNHNDNSYYRVYTIQGYKPIQIRISNHGTHLWTWLDRRYAPSSSINICIVFAENGSTQSDCKIKKILKRGFEVIQYVYNCNILDLNDISLINGAIQNICKNGTYIDPLNNTEKASQKQILKTLNESVGIAANNNNSVEENKNRQYMKQTIKLKESELKRMIYESVRKMISELDWRTYHSAGNKALDRDWEEPRDDDYWERRADNFYGKAEKAFKKKHGIDLSDVTLGQNTSADNDDNYWNAMEDWEDYASDRSQYVNGKGWTKNESKLRKMIGECVRMALKGKRIV